MAAVKAHLGDISQIYHLPPELLPVDRILQRWAVSIGDGLPAELWDDRSRAKPPPLDDDTAIVVDQIILKSPESTRRLVKAWYKTPEPREVIAERLGMSPRSVYRAWRVVLNYLRWRFEESRHRSLLQLLAVVAET